MRRLKVFPIFGFLLICSAAAFAGYTASPSSTTSGGGTWGSILRMSASISGTQATFTISKQSGTFTSSGTMYLREGSITGTIRGSKSVAAGASSTSIPLTLSGTSSRSFYARYESSGGGYAWVGPITISFSNSSPGAPSISSSPTSARVSITVSVSVTRGTDANGDQVKVRCTAIDSNRTDASPYDSGLGTAGSSATATFVFNASGTKTIYCTSFDQYGAGSSTSNRTISVTTNRAPTTPTISSSPSSIRVGDPVNISVTRGTDADGDQVKVRCTAQDSNRTDASPYDSGFGTGGTSVTASFIFNTTGTKTIWCASFDEYGAGGTTSQRTISVVANRAPTAPTISSSPASALRGTSVGVSVTRGIDPDGDDVKVQCTATGSDRTDASPYISTFATGGTSTTATFVFSTTGVQHIYCASFDRAGLNSPTAERTIQVNDSTPTGSLTSPTGSVTGPVTVTASVNVPAGLQKASVVFVPNGIPYVLCEDGTSDPCPATSESWSKPGVDPRWHSASPGSLTLGLWVRDDQGVATLLNQRTITWQPAATGILTAPSGSGAGIITVAGNVSASAGLRKVSVVFVPNGTPLVLCEDGTAIPCPSASTFSFNKADVNPRDYSVSGAASLVLGLWMADDLGRVENVHRQDFQWAPAGAGSFTSPSGSVTGPVRITANASAPQGLRKVSAVFVPGGPSYVLCEDGTTTPCPTGTSGSWDRSGIDPLDYGVTAAGTINVGLWIRDDLGRTDLVATRSFVWTPTTQPNYLNVSDWAQAAAHYLVTHGIVNDTPNHDLRGTSDVNRAELSTMIYRSLGGGQAADANFASWYGGNPTPCFVDVVDPTVWYFKPATYLGGLEFGDGITVFDQQVGIFRPANPISSAWSVKALLEAWDIPPLTSFAGVTLFSDVPTSHPAAGYIYKAKEMGIVTGTNGLFQPDVLADRQNIFLMLHRMLDAQANAASLTVPSPAPLSRDDFAGARPLRRIGVRYEQPVLWGAQVPAISLTATDLVRETVGPLAGVYASILEATLSGVDGGTFVDSRGISRVAHPFCAWSATSGSFNDLTPAGAVPFSRVRWLAPADVSAASGIAANFEITVYCGDDLGHEVRATRTLSLASQSDDATLPAISLSPLPAGKIGGQLVEIQGTAQDGGNVADADYGILRVELFFSSDAGTTWIRLGEAALDNEGEWRFPWLLPPLTGTVQVQARATNLRGNTAQAQRSLTVTATLALEGSVVDGRGRPLENALVTLTGGGLDVSLAADGDGGFRFSNATGTALATGLSYTLTASLDGKSATAPGLTLTSQTGTLHRILILDMAPPGTVASVPGGTYSVPQSIELVCIDDHSECAATYYTLDGTTPGTSSSLYTGPIPVAVDTNLQFFSVDAAGNQEEVVTETYTFASCGFAIDPASQSFGASGGTGSVTVTAPGGCAWTASSGASWIVILSGASGEGNGGVTFSVEQNPGGPREGSLEIAGEVFWVSQDGSTAEQHTLTVQTTGTGSGTVTSLPGGIDCGVDCSETYPAGSQVELQALPDPGSVLIAWDGDLDCVDGMVTLTANRACIAVFDIETTCASHWTSGGPLGGQMRLVAIDPNDPEHLFAGGIGGLFESRNGGLTWSSTGFGPRPVEAFVTDPAVPSTLYVASETGVFRSTDGGVTWTERSAGLVNRLVLSLAIDPVSPSVLWAGLLDLGLYKSTDAGATWSSVSMGGGSVNTIVIDPASPQTIYLGTAGSGVLRSTDGGASWVPINSGLTSLWVYNLLRGPFSTLLASTQAGVHRSGNNGATWETELTGKVQAALAQAPGEPERFFASDRDGNIWRSYDSGDSWNYSGNVSKAGLILGIAVSPISSANLYVATGGRGILGSTDRGSTWQELNSGVKSFRSAALGVVPGDPSVAYTGNTASGLLRTTDGGEQWSRLTMGNSQGAVMDVAVASYSILYVAAQDGIFKTTNAGIHWSNVIGSLSGRVVTALAVAPADPDVVYALASGSLFRSQDGAQSWTAIGAGLGNVSRIEVHPGEPDLVLAQVLESGVGKLFRSDDGGSTWSLEGNGLPVYWVTDLAFDPSLSSTVYSVAGSEIHRSTDGGMNWSVTASLPVQTYSVAVHPLNSSILYVGTWGAGVYRSVDGGASWSAWNDGLEAKEIVDLAVEGASASVYTATNNRGAFAISECPEVPLSVTRFGAGAGTILSSPAGIDCGFDCSENYPAQTHVTLTSVPDIGSAFSGWSGDCAGTGTCEVVMDLPQSVAATFERELYLLTVSAGGAGTGRITSQPGGIDCGTDCSETYPYSTAVLLQAAADPGSVFDGWTGDPDCSDGLVTMSSARACTAKFDRSGQPAALDFYTVIPCRLVDTRAIGPLVSGSEKFFDLTGDCGVPVSAKALSVNVTVVDAGGQGYIALWPSNLPNPGTSVINFRAGLTRANNAILLLATDNSGSVTSEAFITGGGTVHLIIDVNGYFQ